MDFGRFDKFNHFIASSGHANFVQVSLFLCDNFQFLCLYFSNEKQMPVQSIQTIELFLHISFFFLFCFVKIPICFDKCSLFRSSICFLILWFSDGLGVSGLLL